MCPVTGYQGEKLSTSTSPPQKAVKSNEVARQPPKPTSLKSSAAPLGTFLPALSPVCCPPLDTSKDLHILLKGWGNKLKASATNTLIDLFWHGRTLLHNLQACSSTSSHFIHLYQTILAPEEKFSRVYGRREAGGYPYCGPQIHQAMPLSLTV